MEEVIKAHFAGLNLDIRKKSPGYSRFTDQKVTPDVLRFVAECIIEFVTGKPGFVFSSPDIEHFDYFIKNVAREFGKPVPGDKATDSEYDKWPAQIIQALRFAGVLEERGKKGKAIGYAVVKPDILTYIATRPQNAYAFLFQYLTKVLKDSGFHSHVDTYRDLYLSGKLNQTSFAELKRHFESFVVGHTPIKGKYEPRRIFPKIINVLASEHRIPGSVRGRMSKFPFMTSDLVYNRVNFRDKKKAKGISRQVQKEAKESAARVDPIKRVAQAKKRIKELHPNSEVQDQWAAGEATQIHHIFSEKEFPQLADRLENLIRLTPTQHNTKAHPMNNTNIIDPEYQYVCLLEKSYSIEGSIKKGEFDYSRESFIAVINAGLTERLSYDLTFDQIRVAIKKIYRR